MSKPPPPGVIMPDMYDKLGEMLNEALNSGKIPQNKKNDQDSEESVQDSGHFSFNSTENQENNSRKSQKTAENLNTSGKKHEKKEIRTGEVIKLHKYTYNMQFPPLIQKSLYTLDIAYPFTQKDITKQYHKLLKQYHPDTQNTIHTSQSVQNNRQKSIDDIVASYKILCDFFEIK